MKAKKFMAMVLTGATAVSLAACGGSGSGTASSQAETAQETAEAATEAAADAEEFPQEMTGSVVTLKVNFVKSSSDPEYQWYAEYFYDIYEATNGNVGYQLYPSQALGDSSDVLEMAANGQDVVQDCDFSYLASYVPDMSIGMAPYLIQEPEQLQKLWESDIKDEWEAALEEKGMHLLDWHYFGTRELILNSEAKTRDDLKGKKIRCAATPMWNEVVRVLGGNATNTAWSEVYQALSQGVADGAESPYGLLYSSKLYEPCKYVIQTDHLVAATTVVMSQATYDKISPEDQAAMDQVAEDFIHKQVDRVNAVSEEYKQKLIDEGVTFVEIDKTPFIEEAQNTPNNFPEWSDGLYQRVQEAIQ